MSTVIHIEIDALFLIILFAIAYQSAKNVSQQMRRVLFRWTVYGIMTNLALDIVWMLIDGVNLPGLILLNKLVNAVFLASGIMVGCVWYLYVLETLGYKITRKMALLIMSPGFLFTVLNLISMKTGWIFRVSEDNVYFRGPLFWLQTAVALLTLLVSFFHIIIRLINRNNRVPRREVLELLQFYTIPVIGTLVALPYTGMPGTWTCASVSIILIYLKSQDHEIVRDSLTGLNNRKMLGQVFSDFVKQETPDAKLYMFMMDLDDFKKINDTLGHPAGDQALVAASKLFTQAVDGKRAMVARVGGDEFMIMGFFRDDTQADAFSRDIQESFRLYNEQNKLPYHLAVSIGYSPYDQGCTLDEIIAKADEKLYQAKRVRKKPSI